MKPTLISVCLASLLLSACGSDNDTGLLDRPNHSPAQMMPALSALPLIVEMDINTTKTIDTSLVVSAHNLDAWELTEIVDVNGMGEISNLNKSTFDYEARSNGIAVLDYTVAGGGISAQSNVLAVIKGSNSDNDEESTNHNPIAGNVVVELSSNQSITIDLNDSVADIDGDLLSIDEVVSHSSRFMSHGDGRVTYTAAGFVGTDTAAYSVSDGKGGFDLAYIVMNSIDPNPPTPNTPPTASDIFASFNADDLAYWNVDLASHNSGNTIFDADGDELTVDRIFADNGKVSFDGTQIIYTPSAGFYGVDQFTYVITDGKGGYAAATVTLTINRNIKNNTIPTATELRVSNVLDNEPNMLSIDVSGYVNDADSDLLTLALVSGGNGASVISKTEPLTINYSVPLPIMGLRDTLAYVVTDGNGGYAMSTVQIEMVAHNPNAPTTTVAMVKTPSNKAVDIDLSKYIADVETPTSELAVSDLKMTTQSEDHPAVATLSDKTITYTPNGFIGSDVLSYSVSDGELKTTGTLVVISEADGEAQELIANDISLVIDIASEGLQPRVIDWMPFVSSTDVSAEFTLVSATGATLGTSKVNNNTLTYTPSVTSGTDTFVYIVKDNAIPANYALGLVTITLNLPAAPEITELSVALNEGVMTSFITCDECDVDAYTYEWTVNGLTVGNEATLAYQAGFDNYNIRLSVIGKDSYGQETQAQYVVYEKHSVKSIHATELAFAALRDDGTVVAWGGSTSGGAMTSDVAQQLTDVKMIYANQNVFLALKNDDSLVAWGNASPAATIPDDIQSKISDVQSIVGTTEAFAVLNGDGSVVAWGNPTKGGDISSVVNDLTDVIAIYGADNAFSALKEDGTVVVWGSGAAATIQPETLSELNDVVSIASSRYAFAALRRDGTVIAWGSSSHGGVIPAAKLPELIEVKSISSNGNAFVALKRDGSVVAWGNSLLGGTIPAGTSAELVKVETIISNNSSSFGALTQDGNAVVWGDKNKGGGIPDDVSPYLNNITALHSTDFAYAAQKVDGSMIVWGNAAYGGLLPSGEVVSNLSHVKHLVGASRAFAALSFDGSVFAWGDSTYGGGITAQKEAQLKPTLLLLESSLML